MEYRLKVNDGETPRLVDLSKGDDGGWVLTWGDGSPASEGASPRVQTLKCRRISEHHLFAEIDGRGVHLYVASERGVRHVLVDGVPFQVEDGSKRRGKSSKGGKGDVTPPMPGTIMRVLVKDGDAVTEGQELLVMSAMKMETTLYAPKAGVVARVLVSENEQVAAGQQLFEWAKSASNGEDS